MMLFCFLNILTKDTLHQPHNLPHNRPRISIRHLDDELAEIHAGIMVGGVADGADDGEGRVELQADLCNGSAFHLDA